MSIPAESLPQLFVRFLRFGCLAWGGPIAQIAMLHDTFVTREQWVTAQHFNRVLALYQVLPGPEAHELCIYFGMLARGRWGGLVAGLAFMLPGFLLMFALAWAYVEFGLDVHGAYALVFSAAQAAVIALIVRAVTRLGRHVLLDGWLWAVAVLACGAQVLGLHFLVILALGGAAYASWHWRKPLAVVIAVLCAVGLLVRIPGHDVFSAALTPSFPGDGTQSVSASALLGSGLLTGLLTFGGAYTAIPFLQREAVVRGGWLSNEQFLDGIALGGLLPAPLIIFATFVGYVGGGALGAITMTIGVFLPAFAFTLLGHDRLERLVHEPRIRVFLDGVTAAVVGLIAGTAFTLFVANVREGFALAVFGFALAALFMLRTAWSVPVVIACAALAGLAATILAGRS